MFRQLWPYLLRYKKPLLIGAACVVMSNLIGVLTPKIVQQAIDYLKDQIVVSQLIKYSALIVLITAGQGIFRFLMRKYIINVSRYIENDMRNDLFASLQLQSDAFYQRNSAGDIMARLTNDVSAVRSALGPGIMYTINTIASVIFVVIMMLQISPLLTLMALIPVPVMAVVVDYFNHQINKRYTHVQAQYATLSAKVQENLAGMRIVKSYALEVSEINDFNRLNRQYIQKNLSYARVQGAFRPSMMLIVGVSVAMILLFGGKLIITGVISLGQFVAFNLYVGMLVWPSIALGWVMSIFNEGAASMKRLAYILYAAPDIHDDEQTLALSEINGQVTFKDLSFRYPGSDTDVLKDVNLFAPQGQIVGIVGRTGAGKSSLVRLLMRIYNAPSHSLFIDGHDIRDFPLNVLRRDIGYIPQETFLFSDTIASNITFGVNDTDMAAVERAAQLARLHETVIELPEQYQTMLGERGVNLSGGQRQRLAIARAIIKNPRILILDDALSAVDTITEEAILHNLRSVMQGRTCFWISHRISAIMHADSIIVLDRGRIAERGCHEELLAQKGIYADLYEKQQLEESLQSAE